MGIETALIASAAISVAAAAASAAAENQQQQAAANAAEYNQKIQNQAAKVAGQQTAAAEDRQRELGRQVIGRQRAAGSETGFAFAGSTADALDQSARNAELDALTIRYKGRLEASGLRADAKLQGVQAESAKKSATAAIGTGALGAGAAIAGAYGKYKGL